MLEKQAIFSILYKILEETRRAYTTYCGYLVDKIGMVVYMFVTLVGILSTVSIQIRRTGICNAGRMQKLL